MVQGYHHQGGAMAPHAHTSTSLCRVLIGLAILWGFIGLPALGRCADDGDFARATLRGLQGLYVLIEGPCTSSLRINTPGSPVDCHKDKKVYNRGLSWPPSGSLSPGDAFNIGPVDTRRHLRPPPRAAFHYDGWLTPLLAAATAARDRAGLRARSRYGPSTPLPSPASGAATAWPSPTHGWVRTAATAGGKRGGANRSYRTHGTRPT